MLGDVSMWLLNCCQTCTHNPNNSSWPKRRRRFIHRFFFFQLLFRNLLRTLRKFQEVTRPDNLTTQVRLPRTYTMFLVAFFLCLSLLFHEKFLLLHTPMECRINVTVNGFEPAKKERKTSYKDLKLEYYSVR